MKNITPTVFLKAGGQASCAENPGPGCIECSPANNSGEKQECLSLDIRHLSMMLVAMSRRYGAVEDKLSPCLVLVNAREKPDAFRCLHKQKYHH